MKSVFISIKKIALTFILFVGVSPFLMGFAPGNTPAGYTSFNASDIGKVAGVNFSTTLRVYTPSTDENPYNLGAVEWSDGGYFGPGTTNDPDYTMLYYKQGNGYDIVPIYIYNTITGTGGGIETDYVYIPQNAVITSVNTSKLVWLYKYNISAYNVDFNLNGAPGTPPPTQSVGSGHNPIAVTPPTWTNYNFLGWSPSQYAAAGNPAEYYTITQATTLYAIWKYTLYNVSYNTNGGNAISTTIDVNALPNPLPTPIKEGYNFLGWYYDVDYTVQAVGGAVINEDVVLYAKWQQQQAQTYTIMFNSMGGEIMGTLYNQSALPSQLRVPRYEGYAFLGWYYDADYTVQAVGGETINNDVTLYAKWRYIDPLNEDYLQGYNDGKIIGFDEGYTKAMDELGSQETGLFWLTSIVTSIGSILALEIFPSISIGLLIFIPFAFGLLFWFLKILKGGGD